MALEQEIQKLVIAVEALTKAMTQETTVVKPVKQAKPAPTAEPTEAAAAADMFEAPEAEITLEQLSDLLKKHAKALGTKATVALIIKHGADKQTPKIATIPAANFRACFEEAEADLKKLQPKGK